MDNHELNDCCNTTEPQNERTYAMRFTMMMSDVPLQFDMEGYFCPNINCPCKEVTFDFYEANELYDRILFRVSLNYETWQLNSTKIFDGQEDYPKIIHEFMSALDDKFKSFIMSERNNALAALEDSLREDIDYARFEISSLVYYYEIYRSVSGQLIFKFENTEYLVRDYYCANPECDCMDVQLMFTVVKDQKALDETMLVISIDLQSTSYTIEKIDRHFTREEGALLYNKFLDTLGRKSTDVLAERYYRIKKWGRECLLPHLNETMTSNATVKLSRAKIGRNARAPAGAAKNIKNVAGHDYC